jgi:hypothetical protein
MPHSSSRLLEKKIGHFRGISRICFNQLKKTPKKTYCNLGDIRISTDYVQDSPWTLHIELLYELCSLIWTIIVFLQNYVMHETPHFASSYTLPKPASVGHH